VGWGVLSVLSAPSAAYNGTYGNDLKMKMTHHLPVLALAVLGIMPLIISFLRGYERPDDAQNSSYHDNNFIIHQQSLLKGCVATCAFAFATSLRTAIMAPLTRLHEKQQSLLHPLEWTLETMGIIADSMEEFSHKVWENLEREADVWDDTVVSSFTQVPEIDLNASAPCDYDIRKRYLLELLPEKLPEDHKWCKLRDVITRDVLIEYASAQFDTNFNLATHPIILRNVWSQESFEDGSRRLTIAGLLNDPALSNILLPNYFLDAAKTGYDALVPDSNPITLSQFLRNIKSGKAPRSKIGTQVIIEKFPELRAEIFNVSMAKELFSWSENPKEILEGWFGNNRWFSWLPPMSYYPVFIADNKPILEQSSYPRTDLHAEPIGNIAVQLHGERRWTLVATKWSKLLKPTVSKHGRAYVFSNIDPQHDLPKRLKSLPLVYECVTKRGDALWVPPWMWHRVDYVGATDFEGDDTLSLGASIFHFFPKLFASNPLFALLIVPNLIWELLGINTE